MWGYLFVQEKNFLIILNAKYFQKNPEQEPEPTVFATPKQKKNELRNLHMNFIQYANFNKKLNVMKQI